MNRKPKLYILFAGADYYPSGGWRDVVGSFTSVEEAIKVALQREADREYPKYDWWQVVDLDTRAEEVHMSPRIVAEGNNPKEPAEPTARFNGEKIAGTGSSTGLFVSAQLEDIPIVPIVKKRRRATRKPKVH